MSTTGPKPLTHTRQAEAAKPQIKSYTLNAGAGLFLEVNPDGAKYWRYRYTFGGKRGIVRLTYLG